MLRHRQAKGGSLRARIRARVQHGPGRCGAAAGVSNGDDRGVEEQQRFANAVRMPDAVNCGDGWWLAISKPTRERSLEGRRR